MTLVILKKLLLYSCYLSGPLSTMQQVTLLPVITFVMIKSNNLNESYQFLLFENKRSPTLHCRESNAILN